MKVKSSKRLGGCKHVWAAVIAVFHLLKSARFSWNTFVHPPVGKTNLDELKDAAKRLCNVYGRNASIGVYEQICFLNNLSSFSPFKKGKTFFQ